jgi:ParB/RepB/Spo0J family partition protein
MLPGQVVSSMESHHAAAPLTPCPPLPALSEETPVVSPRWPGELIRPAEPSGRGPDTADAAPAGPPAAPPTNGDAAPRFRMIPLDLISPRTDQPRQTMDPSRIEDLAESIRRRGVLQPIRVRPQGDGYVIIAGGRRWAAAHRAGLREIPAVIAESGDDDAFLDALVENIQREDLNAIDRAGALRSLRVHLGARSWEQVGAAVGIRRRQIHNLLNVVRLPDTVLADIRAGRLTEKHGRALLLLQESPTLQDELHERIHDRNLCGDAAMELARRMRPAESLSGKPSPPRTSLSRAVAGLIRHLERSDADELRAMRSRLEELASRIAERLEETAAIG